MQHNSSSQAASQTTSHPVSAYEETPDASDTSDADATNLQPATLEDSDEPDAENPSYYDPIPWKIARRTSASRQRPLWPSVVQDSAQRVVRRGLLEWSRYQLQRREKLFRRRASHWGERRGNEEAWGRRRRLLPFAIAVVLLFATASTFPIIVAARAATRPPISLPVPPTVSPQEGVAFQQSHVTPSPTPGVTL